MNRRHIVPGLMLIGLLAAVAGRALVAAEADAKKAPEPPKASTYAPAEDLCAQVDFYVKRTEGTLADPNDFDDAAKTRLKKDANTLVALALTIGLHDEDSPIKPAAASLMKASQELAKATDYEAAKSAFDRVKKAAAGEPSPGASNDDLKWEKVASLGQLMKQVPTINSALKRGLTPARFESQKAQSAAAAATLAAIAQSVMADTHEVKNPADLDKWFECCGEMRSAAGDANAAIRKGDKAATTAAMARLAKSCESCHAVFRKE